MLVFFIILSQQTWLWVILTTWFRQEKGTKSLKACRVIWCSTGRRCLLQSVTLILDCVPHFLPSEECRNKPDVIFKQNTAVVRCGLCSTLQPPCVSADTYELLSDSFLFFYQSCKKSQQLCVKRFMMTRTDVCVILELCLECLKMWIFMWWCWTNDKPGQSCWKKLRRILHL